MVHPEKWNNMGVDKALCKSLGGSLGRNITDMESISVPGVNIPIRANRSSFRDGNDPM